MIFDAASEGLHVILGMLAVGLILIGLGSVALFTGASANGASGSIKRRWPALALRRGV